MRIINPNPSPNINPNPNLNTNPMALIVLEKKNFFEKYANNYAGTFGLETKFSFPFLSLI